MCTQSSLNEKGDHSYRLMCLRKTGTQFYCVISQRTLINVNFTAPSKSYVHALLASQKLQSPVVMWKPSLHLGAVQHFERKTPKVQIWSRCQGWHQPGCMRIQQESHILGEHRNQGPGFFQTVVLDLSLDPRALLKRNIQLHPSLTTYLIPCYMACALLDGTHPCSALCVNSVNRPIRFQFLPPQHEDHRTGLKGCERIPG